MTVAADTTALNIIYEGLLLMVLSIMTKKKLLSLKSIPNSKLKNHTLLITKMAKIAVNYAIKLFFFVAKKHKHNAPYQATLGGLSSNLKLSATNDSISFPCYNLLWFLAFLKSPS